MCNIFNTFALFMFAKLRRIIQLSKYYIINFILFIIISGGESRRLTYANVKDKVSIVTVGHSEEESEMVNTIRHELLHVTAHICEAYDIDMSGEQACYIMGELCERIFKKLT